MRYCFEIGKAGFCGIQKPACMKRLKVIYRDLKFGNHSFSDDLLFPSGQLTAAFDKTVIGFAVLDVTQFHTGNFRNRFLTVRQIIDFRSKELVAQSERLVFFLLHGKLFLQFFRMPDTAFSKPKAVLAVSKRDG